jgi:DNA-binding HxlR family transcriptional regulator
MATGNRTYGHFCALARALEQVGDRWSLLVVRDLLTGPKRFTDLTDRLGGITPKVLTQRLRDLEEAGILRADRISGRREVWYELTEAGTELSPVVDALAWWGVRHAWRPPLPDEQLHIEHLLLSLVQAVEHAAVDQKPTRWRLDFGPDGQYAVEGGEGGWKLSSGPGSGTPDVSVTGPASAWLPFVFDPTLARAAELGLTITGGPAARTRFLHLIHEFARMVEENAGQG